jgi:hypothetical protein
MLHLWTKRTNIKLKNKIFNLIHADLLFDLFLDHEDIGDMLLQNIY